MTPKSAAEISRQRLHVGLVVTSALFFGLNLGAIAALCGVHWQLHHVPTVESARIDVPL
jgi:hypothetical protein